MSFLDPYDLGVHLFSSEVFFVPMSEGPNSAPLLMASLPSAQLLVEYGANLVSDFDRCSHTSGETKVLLLLQGT
jgi:hypothetical protein